MLTGLRVKSILLSIVILVVLLGIWEWTNQAPTDTKPLTEYELLMGGASQEARVRRRRKSLSWVMKS